MVQTHIWTDEADHNKAWKVKARVWSSLHREQPNFIKTKSWHKIAPDFVHTNIIHVYSIRGKQSKLVTGTADSRGKLRTAGQTGGPSAPECCRRVGRSNGADLQWTCSMILTCPRSHPPHYPCPQNPTWATDRQRRQHRGTEEETRDWARLVKPLAWAPGGYHHNLTGRRIIKLSTEILAHSGSK